MRKVFSSNDVTETALVRDALVHHGVEVIVQNEHSGQSAIPAFRPPAEIWVTRDADYENAREIVTQTIATLDRTSDTPAWTCPSCKENNPQSFDVCWSCGQDKGGGSAPH